MKRIVYCIITSFLFIGNVFGMMHSKPFYIMGPSNIAYPMQTEGFLGGVVYQMDSLFKPNFKDMDYIYGLYAGPAINHNGQPVHGIPFDQFELNTLKKFLSISSEGREEIERMIYSDESVSSISQYIQELETKKVKQVKTASKKNKPNVEFNSNKKILPSWMVPIATYTTSILGLMHLIYSKWSR